VKFEMALLVLAEEKSQQLEIVRDSDRSSGSRAPPSCLIELSTQRDPL